MTRVCVCVVGSVNMDIGLDVAELPRPGETALATSMRSAPGGKGANQAVAAARAGADVRFVGAVGNDATAAQLREHLVDNGVDTDGLITVPGRSGTAVVVVDSGGENLIVVAPEANSRLTLDTTRLPDLLAGCDVVLLQLEIPIAAATDAARAARSAGATVMLNASPPGGDDTALAQLSDVIDVLIVNETEAAQWVWPVAHRVTTLGARGAAYTGDGVEFTVPAPEVDPVDTAGAGDVFAGVLAANWARDRDRALRRACAAGALATLTAGAGDCAPDADAIEQAAAAG
ncbi:PfkB family carbohydrate kinase [Candidatus Mycobacterium wuenschmannii]|uniref:Ribokinase n=1 Tax=Candidatus Mycobacterium wuenschmannii TaxID=3027808 RepID=A0ABY8W6Q3_9MYCO|nr:PfkB family carbohydrate kinase [Candidatus Mycobacterium wuenschmannii]WIM89469.1 PfkB family carbohydrate kinase [Candidatus Mycobacterium wuenschmannii]